MSEVGAVTTCLPSRSTVARSQSCEDLVEAMADEQHGDAAVPQAADDREQPVDLVRRQRRGGLVEDEHAGLDRERLRDLDQLLVGHREPADGRLDVEPDVQLLEQRLRLAPHLAPVDGPQRACRRVADVHVLGHAEVREQARLLVDHRDPERPGLRRAGDHGRLAVDADRARVRLVDAGQDLDQGALARAVLPDQRVDLAGPQVERHVGQGLGRRERLGHAGQRDLHGRLGRRADGGVHGRVMRPDRAGSA